MTITEDESQESVKVGLDTYKEYLGFLGGWRFIVFSQMAMVGFSLFKVLNDYTVGMWASHSEQEASFSRYCKLVFLFALLASLFVYGRTFSLQYLGWRASRRLHDEMLTSVLRAPVNLFFDVTPSGRILNRLSRDLNEADNELAWDVGSLLAMVYQAAAILVVAVLVVPWILLLIPVLLFTSHRLYARVINSVTETARLETLSRSPLLSFLSESYLGAATIRAFARQPDFIAKNLIHLNAIILAN